MSTSENNGHGLATLDFDLHSLVGIRLVHAAPGDAAAVRRQLGPIEARLQREPDIVVRFVDRLPASRLRYLGLDDCAFTDDAFLVLRSKHKARARVQIAFEQIGKRCEIVCERGLPAVPLLVPILNLTALARGALPLHASAFKYNGTGVVSTGWSKGGKTEMLLAYASRGAEYIGDEWVYISADGRRVCGIPEPVRLWDWHLRELPQYRALVRRGDRVRLGTLKLVESMHRAMPHSSGVAAAPAKALNRVMPLLKRQLYVDVHPERLFGAGFGTLSGPFDRLLFVVSHESPDVTVQPIDPREVAERMVFSLQHERADFMTYYMKFRFAFPSLRNELIEQTEEIERELLTRLLADKPAYAVCHPYPVHLASLFDATRALLEAK
jgi:hypothetical protein